VSSLRTDTGTHREIEFIVDRDSVSLIEDTLGVFFPNGWAEEDRGSEKAYRVYISSLEFPARFQKLKLFLTALAVKSIRITEIPDEDWAHNWKQYYRPFRIGARIVIKPSWEEHAAEDRDLIIELDPGMAFGTGQHATTQLCVKLIEKYLSSGNEVLDLGTGSGILGLVALKLGASKVWALDIDPVALEYARENFRRNSMLCRAVIRHGSGLSGMRKKFPLIVANIVASTLVALAGKVPDRLSPGGVFIGSGIIKAREREVREALVRNSLAVVDVIREGEWVALAARRADEQGAVKLFRAQERSAGRYRKAPSRRG
jgi:ribosomal protein L11 methyltransferase